MSIQEGDQLYNNRKFDSAAKAYDRAISKYGDVDKYPNINFREIVEALQKKGDAYAAKAKTNQNNSKYNALRAIHSYKMSIDLSRGCITHHYQTCVDGIELMSNLI